MAPAKAGVTAKEATAVLNRTPTARIASALARCGDAGRAPAPRASARVGRAFANAGWAARLARAIAHGPPMLYAIIFIVAAIVVVYVATLWLLKESREAKGALGERIKRLTGGVTPRSLLEDTQAVIRNHCGGEPDLVVVSHDVTPVYDHLRRTLLREPVERALPAGVVLALAADVDASTLYLRAIEAPKPGRMGADRRIFASFSDIAAIDPVTAAFPSGVAPPGNRAVSIRLTNRPLEQYHMVAEAAWGVSAHELAQQLRRMVFDRQRPPTTPVVVR